MNTRTFTKVRKFLSVVGILSMLSTLVVIIPTASAYSGSDAPYGKEQTDKLIELGARDGTLSSDFGKPVTRAATCLMLTKLYEAEAPEDFDHGFKDVPDGQWYSAATGACAYYGWFAGKTNPDGSKEFMPAKNITREEFSVVAWAMAGKPEVEDADAALKGLPDAGKFSAWSKMSAAWAVNEGLMYKGAKADPQSAINNLDTNVVVSNSFDWNEENETDVFANVVTEEEEEEEEEEEVAEEEEEEEEEVAEEEEEEVVAVAGDVNVSVSSASPAAKTLLDLTAYNEVTVLTFDNPLAEEVKITEVTVTKGAASNTADTAISGVALWADGRRHGSSFVSLSDTKAVLTVTSDAIVVPAGGKKDVGIVINLAAQTGASGTVQMAVNAGTDVKMSTAAGAVANAAGTFPLAGANHFINDGANIVAAVTLQQTQVSAGVRNVDIGVVDQVVGKFTFNETTSNEEAVLTHMKFFNNGTSADGDIKNIDLVGPDGTVLVTLPQTVNKYAEFDLTTLPDGGYKFVKGAANKEFTVRADVTGGSSRTTQFIIQYDYDTVVKRLTGSSSILVTLAGGDTTWPVGDTANFNTVNANPGTLTVAKDNTSPSGSVAPGSSDVVLGVFRLNALGEDIEVESLGVEFNADNATTTSSTTCAAAASCDLTGSIKVLVVDLDSEGKAIGGGTTVLNQTASTAALWDSDSDAVTLSSKKTIKANTVSLLKVIGNIHSTNAADDETFVASVETIGYKRVISGTTATLSNGVMVSANTLTVDAAQLTVTRNTGIADQTIVAGGANSLIASFNLQAGPAAGANVTGVTLDLTIAGGGAIANYTNLKLCKANTACSGGGNQYGTTVASPTAADNTFSVSNLSVVASGVAQVDVHVDINPSATGTILTLMNASDISATASNSVTLSTVPAATTNLQTMTLRSAGTLSVTEPSQTLGSVVHVNEPLMQVLALSMKPSFEPVIVDKLHITFTNGSFNLGSTVYLKKDGSDTAIASGTVVRDNTTNAAQYAVLSGFTDEIAKDVTRTYTVWATTAPGGTLRSQETVAVNAAFVKATGKNSGQPINPTLTATEVSTASAVSAAEYNIGDILFYDDGTTIASSGMVLEKANVGRALATADAAAPFTTGLVLNDPDDSSVAITAGNYVTMYDKNNFVYDRASTAVVNAFGGNGGSALAYFVDYSADIGFWAVITSGVAAAGSLAEVTLEGGGTNTATTTASNGTGGATDIARTVIDTAGTDADFIARITQSTAVNPASATGLTAGDVAFLNDAGANVTFPFMLTSTLTNTDLTDNNEAGQAGTMAGNGFVEGGDDTSGSGTASLTIDAGDMIFELNRISSETLATGTNATFDYLPGDVVFVFDSSDRPYGVCNAGCTATTLAHGFYVVTSPLRKGEAIIGASIVRNITFAAGDIVTKVSSPIAGNPYRTLAGELELKVAASSPASNAQLSIGTDVTIAILDAKAFGVPVYIESIVVQKVGSGESHLDSANADRDNDMKVLVNGSERGFADEDSVGSTTSCAGCWVGSDLVADNDASGTDDYYLIDFFDPVRVETTSTTTLTLQLTTTATSGTWAVNETLGFRIGGTSNSGMRSTLGVDYYWDTVQGDGGTTPTAASPVSESDSYPIVSGSLKN